MGHGARRSTTRDEGGVVTSTRARLSPRKASYCGRRWPRPRHPDPAVRVSVRTPRGPGRALEMTRQGQAALDGYYRFCPKTPLASKDGNGTLATGAGAPVGGKPGASMAGG